MMKFDVVNQGDAYRLTAAVLVYTNPATRHAFATKHEVATVDGRPVVCAGAPLGDTDYRNLVQALAPSERPQMVWNDSRVLARGLGRILWWSPAQRRSMFFKQSNMAANTFTGKGVAPCPGLVLLGTQRALYLYAFKGEQPPTRTTKLFQAPFFNVWSSGQVCVGNAALPPEDDRMNPQAWERMFFGSHFTHPNFTEKNRLLRGCEPAKFWQSMLTNPPAAFPEEVLVDVKLQVNDLADVDSEAALHRRARAIGEF